MCGESSFCCSETPPVRFQLHNKQGNFGPVCTDYRNSNSATSVPTGIDHITIRNRHSVTIVRGVVGCTNRPECRIYALCTNNSRDIEHSEETMYINKSNNVQGQRKKQCWYRLSSILFECVGLGGGCYHPARSRSNRSALMIKAGSKWLRNLLNSWLWN